MVCSYSPNLSNWLVHLNAIDKAIEFYSETYGKILIAGDFNAQVRDIKIKLYTFCSIWNLKSVGKNPTCFKNPNNSSYIDLFLTNSIRSFQETQVFETGLSDFHEPVVTVLKNTFPKSPPRMVTQKLQNFSNDLLPDDLNSLLNKKN